jgi:broad specificity phosphatase PhoE
VGLLYLIRHGQAGTRDDYDRLSALGREQALLLGRHFSSQGIHFDRVIRGGLRRQRETVECALLGVEAQVDERWSEFDLDAVYAGIAPQLAAVDPSFAIHYEQLRRALAGGDAGVHRHWVPADVAVVQAWIAGRFASPAESWTEFCSRVYLALDDAIAESDGERRVAVFTSATPVGLAVARALHAPPAQAMELAAPAVNTNVSVLRVLDGEARLFQFNTMEHLNEARLRTFR